MYQDLQISRLRALVTVYDLGGFRVAARALHITQPAVTQQIKQLSHLIKAPVFVSTRGGLVLSPKGAELLGYARRMLALNDETAARFAPAPPGATRLTIGVSDQLAEALPSILKQVMTAAPQAQICALTGPSESLAEQISTGQLDLALLLNPTTLRSGASQELGLLNMDWFGQPTLRGSRGLPVALFTEPCALRSNIVEALNKSKAPWRIAYEGAEFAGLRAAVKAGLGVACLIANSDDLWGLPRSRDLPLPGPPGPVPVTMAVPERGSLKLATISRDALELALASYPFAA